MNDLGELEQGLKILERWLVDQLVGRVELLIVLALIRDIALILLVFVQLKSEFKVILLSPVDVGADVVHFFSACFWHVRDCAELREESCLQVSVYLLHHCLSLTISLNCVEDSFESPTVIIFNMSD